MNIVFLRLQTGEDIITEIMWLQPHDGSNGHYVLKSPRKIVYAQSEKLSKVNILLTPWVFESLTMDSNFILYPKDIITTSLPSENLLEYYMASLSNKEEMVQKANKKPPKDETNDGETKISNSEFLKMVKAKLVSLPKRRLN